MSVTPSDLTKPQTVPFRVLLADDQAALRSALKLLLEQQPGIEIVGEAVDATGLQNLTTSLRPDLILLDWELPGVRRAYGSGAVILALRQAAPNLQIIVLSGRPESLRSALAAGATACVSKADPPEQLLTSLRKAQQSAKMQNV